MAGELAAMPPASNETQAATRDFTGREEELEKLQASISLGGLNISSRAGQGGMGKTALALMLADQLKAQFPDAQVFVSLRGLSERPLQPAEAMACVLRAFDPEAKLPRQEQKLAAIYRSVLEGKRVLLLMDGAENLEQVRPLIPPQGCYFLVTSLERLGLHGFPAAELGVLRTSEAQDLLLRVEPRIGTEAPAIADLRAYVPLALRLAASALAEHVELTPPEYRKRLAEERNRPKLMDEVNQSVEATLS